MTHSFEIIAYTYEADCHCLECTRKRFGSETNSSYEQQGITDNEGNNIHPIFAGDEIRSGTACGDCFEIIYGYQDNPCVECINLNEYDISPNDGIYETNCHTVATYPDNIIIGTLLLCEDHYFNQCSGCATKCSQCGDPGEYAVKNNWYCYNCADEQFTVCVVYECDCRGDEHTATPFEERTEEFKEQGFVLPTKQCILG